MTARQLAQHRATFFRPYIGRRFKHFKGAIYEVDAIFVHSESAEILVGYHPVSDPETHWVRPVYNFFSPVDKNKYPDVQQHDRFEEVKDVL